MKITTLNFKTTYLLKLSGLILVTTLIMTGCSESKAEDTTPPAPAVTNTIESFGTIKSKNITNVLIEFSSNLTSLPVREGQSVKKGDVLATVDMSNYISQIQAKELDVRMASLEKEKLVNSNALTLDHDLTYKKLVEGIKLALYQHDIAKRELANQRELLISGAISQSDFDAFKEKYEIKKKALYDAQAEADQYKKSKAALVHDIAIRETQAASAQITTHGMQSKLNKDYILDGKIICPYDQGVVFDISYATGDTVNIDKKLLSIADSRALIVEAEIVEEFVGDIQKGAEVTITPVADKARTYKGKVERVYEMAKVKNGETIVPIEISIDNKDGFLKPNFNVDVSIKKSSKK